MFHYPENILYLGYKLSAAPQKGAYTFPCGHFVLCLEVLLIALPFLYTKLHQNEEAFTDHTSFIPLLWNSHFALCYICMFL